MAMDLDQKIVAYTDCAVTQDSSGNWNIVLVGKNARDEEIKRREFDLSQSEFDAFTKATEMP